MMSKPVNRTPRCSAPPAPTPREPMPAWEPPMRRYPHPIPAPAACTAPAGGDAVSIRVLEELQRQNQLLIDLLGAVNGLTAALLCRETKN